jgi:NTP pyrophosphatase (non-canonical NTP hydrolase)
MEHHMRNREKVMFIIQEECAEVIQAISKIYRFGLDTEWEGVTNKQALIRELGDVLAVIEILITETDININAQDIEDALEAKKKKLDIYLPVEK